MIRLHITNDGSILWSQHGIRHNKYGPSNKWNDGANIWCQHGRLHRLNGPAVEWGNGKKEWAIDGVEYSDYLEYLVESQEFSNRKKSNGN